MAISDSQKIDYLWKKVGYSAAKTDVTAIKEGYNEAIPSPLQIRGDKIMANAASIPTTIPGANTSIVSVYTTSLPIECTNDATASTNRTWKTNLTDWISPEFGSTYQVKVYVNLINSAGNAATAGTQVFASGSNNNDEWFFDYQSGVLNFIGTNLPNGVSFTGKSVYVSGARYTGAFGISVPSLGNITFSGNTITSNDANGNIIISAPGTGTVQITGTDAMLIPTGNTAARPASPIQGYIRFNTDLNLFEYYDGSQWLVPGQATITSALITPDGTSNTYSVSGNVSAAGLLVSINGTMQQPLVSYNVSNGNIIFTEVPLPSDIIEVRKITAGVTSVDSLTYGTYTAVTLDTANVSVKGNLMATCEYKPAEKTFSILIYDLTLL